jgi:hypothetical protein
MLTISKKVAAIASIVLLLGLAIVAKIAWDQHVAIAAASKLSGEDQKKVDFYNDLIAKRDAADIEQQALSEKQQAQVKTSADAVKVITKYVPVPTATPDQPSASFVVDKQAFTEDEAKRLPESPTYVVQTQDQSVLVAKELIACNADRKSLDSCKADVSDMKTALDVEKHQAQTWENAAKGGTKTQRFMKFLKCAGFAGVGAAGGAFTKQPLWAGIGAGAGVAACQLF